MQSKVSFENDVFRRVIFSISQLEAQSRTGTEETKKRCCNLALGMLGAIKISDVSTYERVKRDNEGSRAQKHEKHTHRLYSRSAKKIGWSKY